MTQLNDEHFELHDQNKAERYERQKIKFLEDKVELTRDEKIVMARRIMQETQAVN